MRFALFLVSIAIAAPALASYSVYECQTEWKRDSLFGPSHEEGAWVRIYKTDDESAARAIDGKCVSQSTFGTRCNGVFQDSDHQEVRCETYYPSDALPFDRPYLRNSGVRAVTR